MRRRRFLNTALPLSLALAKAGPLRARAAGETGPTRLKRADSFLGIHFDFHASDDCTEIGKHVTPGMIGAVIAAVHPDYIQCDCKGHRGLCSYPSKAGNPAPGFVRDQLRVWREVTAARGVSLFLHYSGVWDTEAGMAGLFYQRHFPRDGVFAEREPGEIQSG